MTRSGQRKRKTHGVVRDLDEAFLRHRNASENDATDDNNSSDSSVNFSNDGGTGACESDDDCSTEQNDSGISRDERSTKETGNERNIGKGSEKKVGNRTSRNVSTLKKKNKNQNKSSPAKSKNGGIGQSSSITIDDDRDHDHDDNHDHDDDHDGEAKTATATTTLIPGTTSNKKKKPKIALDSFDVVLPSSIIDGGGCGSENQCTLLVEVSDPKDAIALGEFGGSVGAIGRFESDPNGITLDLKGNQYRGSLLPGPTCMVLGFPSSVGFKKKETTTTTTTTTTCTGAIGGRQAEEGSPSATVGTLRVEGITDEYATLVQIDDHMKKLDAIVTGNHQDGIDGDEMNRDNQLKDKIGKSQ
mmetsp:Transcript_4629/g.13347  ORF Transcript_4629/g.13347 Transcript_4629/m.13347 type:complete len:358 (+) Transcript_4629:278-1351(+)